MRGREREGEGERGNNLNSAFERLVVFAINLDIKKKKEKKM